MSEVSYPFAVGRIKALEGTLLNASQWNRLLEETEEGALKLLKETGYGAGGDSLALEDLISTESYKLYQLIREISPDPLLTDLFWLPVDAHNLKVLFKNRLSDSKNTELLLQHGCFDPEILRVSVENGEYSLLPELLYEALTKLEEDMQAGLRDPGEISNIIDKAIYAYIIRQLKKEKNPLIAGYFSSRIDFTNIITMLRARALHYDEEKLMFLLLPGGETSPVKLGKGVLMEKNSMEELFENNSNRDVIRTALARAEQEGVGATSQVFEQALLEKLLQEKDDPFGIGPIACYIVRKQNEAKQLRILFAAKRADIRVTAAELGLGGESR
ncbi:MAG: V-type ATPase subunit [Christensenellales bacterium]